MKKPCTLFTVACLAILGAGPAAAADEASMPSALKLAAARAQISAKNWPAAIAELKRVNDTRSADWNNLMGYSVRKGSTPDYAAAERYYDTALRIDPSHRGALEYSGELYLLLGHLDKAEDRQARLARVCPSPCEELDDLGRAIEKYKADKAAGVAYVPPAE